MYVAILSLFLCADPIPQPPTVANILAVRAEIAALVKKEAAMVAEFNKELSKLGGHSPVEPFGIGKQGPPGPRGPPGPQGPKGEKGDKGDPGTMPQPPPKPANQNLYILVIEQTEQATAARGAMFANAEFAARIKAGGHKWRCVDADVKDANGQVPTDLVYWLNKAKGKTLPYLFLVDAKANVVFEGPCPATAAAFLETLKANGG